MRLNEAVLLAFASMTLSCTYVLCIIPCVILLVFFMLFIDSKISVFCIV